MTDKFDYEVPFSGVKDFDLADPTPVGEINGWVGVSGVDTLDLQIGAVTIDEQNSRLPLRKVIHPKNAESVVQANNRQKLSIRPVIAKIAREEQPSEISTNSGRVAVVSAKEATAPIISKTRKIRVGIAGKLLMAVGVGLGAYKLTQILT